jgi:protein-disulfide isomerase
MLSRSRIIISLLLLLVGAGLAGALLPQHYGLGETAAALCADTGAGCDTVNRSAWSELAGVPLAALGLVFYASLASLLALSLCVGDERRTGIGALVLVALGIGLVVDLALLGIQAFSIGAYCSLCLTTYALTLGALIALAPARRALAGLGRLVDAGEGALVIAAWGITTVAASAAVAALVLQYEAKAQVRDATLLGGLARVAPVAATPVVDLEPETAAATLPAAPADEPSEKPALAASAEEPDPELERYRQQVQEAQAEASRLRGILDDPRKTEQYRSDQALAKFAAAPAATLDLDGTPSKGPEDAAVRVVEYSDFLCPYCRSLAGALTGFLPKTAGRVAISFKHYPLDPGCNPNVQGPGHAGSCALALGAICAEEQGLFWPYHDKVFADQKHNPGIPEVLAYGDAAGMERDALEKCVVAPETRQRLDRDIAEATRLKVTSTPTVYINGRQLPRINDFVRVVNREIERLGFPPLEP